MNQTTTETLTGKQKDNRKYYAKNAEKIKAQKRASYAKRKKVKPVRKIEKPIPATKVSSKPEAKRTNAVRSRIEDFKLAREVGIKITDL